MERPNARNDCGLPFGVRESSICASPRRAGTTTTTDFASKTREGAYVPA